MTVPASPQSMLTSPVNVSGGVTTQSGTSLPTGSPPRRCRRCAPPGSAARRPSATCRATSAAHAAVTARSPVLPARGSGSSGTCSRGARPWHRADRGRPGPPSPAPPSGWRGQQRHLSSRTSGEGTVLRNSSQLTTSWARRASRRASRLAVRWAWRASRRVVFVACWARHARPGRPSVSTGCEEQTAEQADVLEEEAAASAPLRVGSVSSQNACSMAVVGTMDARARSRPDAAYVPLRGGGHRPGGPRR